MCFRCLFYIYIYIDVYMFYIVNEYVICKFTCTYTRRVCRVFDFMYEILVARQQTPASGTGGTLSRNVLLSTDSSDSFCGYQDLGIQNCCRLWNLELIKFLNSWNSLRKNPYNLPHSLPNHKPQKLEIH